MTKIATLPTLMILATALAGCSEGLISYQKAGPDSVIARASDSGFDGGTLQAGDAAIAYDPDGCQGWIMDDGVEGYSGRRYDPVSGLPVCDGQFPPGTVIQNYQTQSAGVKDSVPN